MLLRLILRRFRSFRSGALDFANPTFLVGRNGSGKSSLADAIAFLSDAMASPLPSVCARRGGMLVLSHRASYTGRPADLGLAVRLRTAAFAARYAFSLRTLKQQRLQVVREQCIVTPEEGTRCWFDRGPGGLRCNVPALRPALEPSLLALPLLMEDVRFGSVVRFLAGMRLCRIEPGSLRRPQDPDDGTRLHPAGENAASVLRRVRRRAPEDFEMLLGLLRKIVPGTVGLKHRQRGSRLGLEFQQDFGVSKPVRLPASGMSDGTLHAAGVLTAVFQRPKPSALVIEEPEATLHPGALAPMQVLLRHASRKTQVIVTTRSPDLLEAKWIGDSCLRLVGRDTGSSRIGTLPEPARPALRKHLTGARAMPPAEAAAPEPLIAKHPSRPNLFGAFAE